MFTFTCRPAIKKGYLCLVRNPTNEGNLEVFATEKTPEGITGMLRERNASLIKDYELLECKLVDNPSEVERKIHSSLEQQGKRFNPRKNLFKVTRQEVLDLCDQVNPKAPRRVKGTKGNRNSKRDLSKVFKDGQKLRYSVGDKQVVGIYDSERNGIIYNEYAHLSLGSFRREYWKEMGLTVPSVNAWDENVEYELNGKWVKTTTDL